ncbi:hypothetical protein AB0C13_36465, partial [Streptomyces sp. NPDC049099]|uniref:hypothetical protein n=1 Tax=Streptomyces sp. NPDC049099 TaxID=3155768 RepID=UPI00342207EA
MRAGRAPEASAAGRPGEATCRAGPAPGRGGGWSSPLVSAIATSVQASRLTGWHGSSDYGVAL